MEDLMLRYLLTSTLTVFLVFVLGLGCTKEPEVKKPELTSVSHLSPNESIAIVNAAPITVKDLERAMGQRFKMMKIKREEMSPGEHRLMELATFESLVSRMILRQEAQKRGFSVDASSLAEAKNEILKTLPEGMTPDSFVSNLGINMGQFEKEIKEDMIIAMLQESVLQRHPQAFNRLIERLELEAKVKLLHAPGGEKWNKVGQNTPSSAQPVPEDAAQKGSQKMHWRDQSKKMRRDKAKAAGLKPWDEGYPE
jgi:hypothetical protein